MKQIHTILTVFSVLLVGLVSQANGSQREQGTVTYNNRFRFLFDVDGNQVDAEGAKIYCQYSFKWNLKMAQLTS